MIAGLLSRYACKRMQKAILTIHFSKIFTACQAFGRALEELSEKNMAGALIQVNKFYSGFVPYCRQVA
jgi:hypothetical protein